MGKKKPEQSPVKYRTLLMRLRRRIAKERRGFLLNATRTKFLVIREKADSVERQVPIDELEAFAKEIGVLRPWERIATEEEEQG